MITPIRGRKRNTTDSPAGAEPLKDDNPDKGTETLSYWVIHIFGLSYPLKDDNPDKGTETNIQTMKFLYIELLKDDNPDKGTETIKFKSMDSLFFIVER